MKRRAVIRRLSVAVALIGTWTVLSVWKYRSFVDEQLVVATSREMSTFGVVLSQWCLKHDSVPPATLSQAIELMKSDTDAMHRIQYMRSLPGGVDAWGNKLDYRVNASVRTFSIRSFGRNRVDDHGKADDIYVEREFP